MAKWGWGGLVGVAALLLAACASSPTVHQRGAPVVSTIESAAAAKPDPVEVAAAPDRPVSRAEPQAAFASPQQAPIPAALASPSPKFDAAYLENLKNCLVGYVSCRKQGLSAEDTIKVDEAEGARNVSACMAGYSNCQPLRLNAEQQAKVADADRKRNLSACLSGYSNCRPTLLAPPEAKEVDLRDNQRNLAACLAGYSNCAADRLSEPEAVKVRLAAYDRNAKACIAGYSTCQAGELSDADRERTRSAAAQRNLANCLAGYSNCQFDQLSPEDRARVEAARETVASKPTTPGAGAYVPTYIPPTIGGCAENGSCYGDVSAATGRPKTVAVRGYYRRDGTYVRGHYRSK